MRTARRRWPTSATAARAHSTNRVLAHPHVGVSTMAKRGERQPDHQQHDAGGIGQPAGVRLASFRKDATAEQEADDPDGQVDEERPPPAEVLDHEGAHGGARGTGDRADRPPDGHGHRDLVAGEGLEDEGERRRDEGGGADRLQHPRRDQGAGGRRQAAQHRRHGEDHDRGEERAPAPDPVRQPAGRDQQGGEDDRVGVEDPRERRRRDRREAGRDRREGDEQDRRVEEDGEHGQAGRGEDGPLAARWALRRAARRRSAR